MNNKKYLLGGVLTGVTLCSILGFNCFVFPNVLASAADTPKEIEVTAESSIDETDAVTEAGIDVSEIITGCGISVTGPGIVVADTDETETATGAGIDMVNAVIGANITEEGSVVDATIESSDEKTLGFDIAGDKPDVNAISVKKAMKIALEEIEREDGIYLSKWNIKARYIKAQAPMNNGYWNFLFYADNLELSELSKVNSFVWSMQQNEERENPMEYSESDKYCMVYGVTVEAMKGEVSGYSTYCTQTSYQDILNSTCYRTTPFLLHSEYDGNGVLRSYGKDGLLESVCQASQEEYDIFMEKKDAWLEKMGAFDGVLSIGPYLGYTRVAVYWED